MVLVSGATPSFFPLDLMFFHFIYIFNGYLVLFKSELNVIHCTILCNCNSN